MRDVSGCQGNFCAAGETSGGMLLVFMNPTYLLQRVIRGVEVLDILCSWDPVGLNVTRVSVESHAIYSGQKTQRGNG